MTSHSGLACKPRVRTVIRSGIWKLEQTCRLSSHVRRAARRVFKCKTPSLGKHVHVCDHGHEHVRWNSCRHRSCPECSWGAKKRWLTKTRERLLPVPHHHVVFTIASELNELWRANVPAMQHLLFASARDTIVALFADRYDGAYPGMIATLHTWGRSLALHPHLHIILTRGGVNADGKWIEPRRNLKAVLPVKVVSRLFQGKFLSAVRNALEDERLVLPQGVNMDAMRSLIAEAYSKKWSVFIGPAGTRSETIVNYLGRYVSGGPIGNSRILAIGDGEVSFLFRDYRVTGKDGLPIERPMTLPQVEFLRRWFSHVPIPYSKVVRSYGIYSSSYRGPAARPRPRRHVREPLPAPALSPALDIRRCPDCGAPLRLVFQSMRNTKRAPPLGRLG